MTEMHHRGRGNGGGGRGSTSNPFTGRDLPSSYSATHDNNTHPLVTRFKSIGRKVVLVVIVVSAVIYAVSPVEENNGTTTPSYLSKSKVIDDGRREEESPQHQQQQQQQKEPVKLVLPPTASSSAMVGDGSNESNYGVEEGDSDEIQRSFDGVTTDDRATTHVEEDLSRNYDISGESAEDYDQDEGKDEKFLDTSNEEFGISSGLDVVDSDDEEEEENEYGKNNNEENENEENENNSFDSVVKSGTTMTMRESEVMGIGSLRGSSAFGSSGDKKRGDGDSSLFVKATRNDDGEYDSRKRRPNNEEEYKNDDEEGMKESDNKYSTDHEVYSPNDKTQDTKSSMKAEDTEEEEEGKKMSNNDHEVKDKYSLTKEEEEENKMMINNDDEVKVNDNTGMEDSSEAELQSIHKQKEVSGEKVQDSVDVVSKYKKSMDDDDRDTKKEEDDVDEEADVSVTLAKGSEKQVDPADDDKKMMDEDVLDVDKETGGSVLLVKGSEKQIDPDDDDEKKIDLDEETVNSKALLTTEHDEDEEDEEADDSKPMEKKEEKFSVGKLVESDSKADAIEVDGEENKKKTPGYTTKKVIDSPAFEKEYDNCIVGAGLSGSVIAENYASQFGQTSLILEKRHHIAGNCFDYIDKETGILVSLFGAHLFHTKHERVWDYVQRFSEWVPYEHKVLGMVNGKIVPIPVTIDTVNILFDKNITNSDEMDEFMKKERVPLLDKKGSPREAENSEEVALATVGQRLYDLIFKPYTYKQWAKYPVELGPEVLARIPVRNDFDGRYFSDKHQALPKNGYTKFFENILDNPKITVSLNTDYHEVKDKLKCKRLYYTGQIDTYFADLGWPKLEYRSLDFEQVVQKNTPGYFQPAPVVNHPQFEDVKGNKIDYTRIVEYKHLLNQTSDHTIYVIERSKDGGEPYYPVPNQENKDLYKKYQNMADKEEGVTFVGRLANYKYFNMDDAILNALELFDKDTKNIVKTKQIDPADNYKKTRNDDDRGTKKTINEEEDVYKETGGSVALAKGGEKQIELADDVEKKLHVDEGMEEDDKSKKSEKSVVAGDSEPMEKKEEKKVSLKTTKQDEDEEADDSELLIKDEKKVSLKTTVQVEDKEADDSESLLKKENKVSLETTKKDEDEEAADSKTFVKDGEVEDDSKYDEPLKKKERDEVDEPLEKDGMKESMEKNELASGKLEKDTIKEKSAIKKN